MTNKQRHELKNNQKIKGNQAYYDLMVKKNGKEWADNNILVMCPVNFDKEQRI